MKDSSRKLWTRGLMMVCALLLVGTARQSHAQQHPAYLQALQKLREARIAMQSNFSSPERAQAASQLTGEINAAIGELKQASRLDEKNLGAAPPPNPNLPPGGRFHRAYELLQMAQHLAGSQEDDPIAIPARDRAEQHIANGLAIAAKRIQ